MTVDPLDEDVAAVRARLQASVRRDQSIVYSSAWTAGGGVMGAVVGGSIATLSLIPGLIVMVVGAIMLSVGIVRAREGFRRIADATEQLEATEPRPLPPARVV